MASVTQQIASRALAEYASYSLHSSLSMAAHDLGYGAAGGEYADALATCLAIAHTTEHQSTPQVLAAAAGLAD